MVDAGGGRPRTHKEFHNQYKCLKMGDGAGVKKVHRVILIFSSPGPHHQNPGSALGCDADSTSGLGAKLKFQKLDSYGGSHTWKRSQSLTGKSPAISSDWNKGREAQADGDNGELGGEVAGFLARRTKLVQLGAKSRTKRTNSVSN